MAAKHIAEVGGKIYYLVRVYDEHGVFVSQMWTPAAKFDTMKQAEAYLLEEEETETTP